MNNGIKNHGVASLVNGAALQNRIHAEYLRIAGEKFLDISRGECSPDALRGAAEDGIRAADIFVEALLQKAAKERAAEQIS